MALAFLQSRFHPIFSISMICNMIVLKYLEANKKNTTTSKMITPNCVPICFGTLEPATMLHFPYISEPFMKLTTTKVAAECILYILPKSPVWVKLYDP